MRPRELAKSTLIFLVIAAACGRSAHQTAEGPRPSDAAITVERGITFCRADAAEQKLDLVRLQKRSAPSPVVIYVPGGSWQAWSPRVAADPADAGNDANGRPDLTYSPLIRLLASRGFAVAIVYNRGAPAHRFPAHVEDVSCAVRSLRATHRILGIDPDRVGLLGGSSGGHIVALAALSDDESPWRRGQYSEHSSRVQAAVIAEAPTDLTGPIPPQLAPLFISVFGTAEAGSGALIAASAATHATPDDPPILLLHGTADRIVRSSQSEALHKALTKVGIRSRLQLIEAAEHGILWPPEHAQTRPTPIEVREIIARFFESQLSSSSGMPRIRPASSRTSAGAG